jgi:hypothetical protein
MLKNKTAAFFLGFSLFLFLSPVKAQNAHSFGLAADYGFLFLHSQDIAPMGQSYPWAISAEYGYWLLKDSYWQNCHCYPKLGISLGYHSYNNPQVLGYGIPLHGFFEPWYRLKGNTFLNLRGGVGLAWASQPYNAETNPLNLSYSTPVSAFVMIGLGLGYTLNDQWKLGLQARYNHVSNGGFREPNKGLNYPSLNIMADYALKPFALIAKAKQPFNPQERKKALQLTLFAAGKAGGKIGEGVNEQEVTFLVSGAEWRYSHQVGRSSALLVGGSFINNQAYQRQIEKQELSRNANQVTLAVGHEFLLGNFKFAQVLGTYLYKNYHPTPGFYQRYTLDWRFASNWQIGTGIKAHGHVGEFIDVRFSYRFPI